MVQSYWKDLLQALGALDGAIEHLEKNPGIGTNPVLQAIIAKVYDFGLSQCVEEGGSSDETARVRRWKGKATIARDAFKARCAAITSTPEAFKDKEGEDLPW